MGNNPAAQKKKGLVNEKGTTRSKLPVIGELRFCLCLTRMWADDNIECDITSSDIEFLRGEEMSDAKILKKKDKPESHAPWSKARNNKGSASGGKKLPALGEASFVLEENVG